MPNCAWRLDPGLSGHLSAAGWQMAPAPVDKTPERADASRPALVRQFGPDLFQHDAGLLVNEAQDQWGMRLDARGAPVSNARTRCSRTLLPPSAAQRIALGALSPKQATAATTCSRRCTDSALDMPIDLLAKTQLNHPEAVARAITDSVRQETSVEEDNLGGGPAEAHMSTAVRVKRPALSRGTDITGQG
jgi:hypothetical protein